MDIFWGCAVVVAVLLCLRAQFLDLSGAYSELQTHGSRPRDQKSEHGCGLDLYKVETPKQAVQIFVEVPKTLGPLLLEFELQGDEYVLVRMDCTWRAQVQNFLYRRFGFRADSIRKMAGAILEAAQRQEQQEQVCA